MQLIIVRNKDSLYIRQAVDQFHAFSNPSAKQVVLRPSPSTDLSEIIVTEIKELS